jgi:hypothetical protein
MRYVFAGETHLPGITAVHLDELRQRPETTQRRAGNRQGSGGDKGQVAAVVPMMTEERWIVLFLAGQGPWLLCGESRSLDLVILTENAPYNYHIRQIRGRGLSCYAIKDRLNTEW